MAIRHCFRKIQRKEMHQTMTKVDIFSGFLGAGKTTLIKKLIPEAFHGEKLVLIENEFGEIGIDGGFLEEGGYGGDIAGAKKQQPVHHVVRAGQIADAPAGHGIGFAEALAQDQLLFQFRIGTEIGAVSAVGQLVVNIVADDKNRLS